MSDMDRRDDDSADEQPIRDGSSGAGGARQDGPSESDRDASGGDQEHLVDVQVVYDVAAVALDALSPGEAAAVRAAAATDRALAADLVAMREVAAELAFLAPLSVINPGRSAGIRSRLVARAVASRGGRPAISHSTGSAAGPAGPAGSAAAITSAHVPPTLTVERGGERGREGRGSAGAAHQRGGSGVQTAPAGTSLDEMRARAMDRSAARSAGRPFAWLALAASIALAATGIQLWRVSAHQNQFARAVAAREATLTRQLGQLRTTVSSRDSVISALTGMNTRVIDLASYSSLSPAGRMFWDQKTNEWTMYASHLKQPPSGKTYQLWLIASNHPAPISAGTFAPDSTGSAVMHARYALEPGALKRIAVTEEPAGGMPAPTGPVMFVGGAR